MPDERFAALMNTRAVPRVSEVLGLARPGNDGVFLTGVDVGAPPPFGVGCDYIIRNEGTGVRLAIATGRQTSGGRQPRSGDSWLPRESSGRWRQADLK